MSRRSEELRQKNRLAAEEAIRQQLSKAHTLGLSRGTYAMAQVIMNKATNAAITPEERLNDIIDFCSKARNPDQKSEDTAESADSKAKESDAEGAVNE